MRSPRGREQPPIVRHPGTIVTQSAKLVSSETLPSGEGEEDSCDLIPEDIDKLEIRSQSKASGFGSMAKSKSTWSTKAGLRAVRFRASARGAVQYLVD